MTLGSIFEIFKDVLFVVSKEKLLKLQWSCIKKHS